MPAYRPFLGVLREVERELVAPLPGRTRFLRELEYDLESLGRSLEASGMAAAEARDRAVEALVPTGAALGALGSLHESSYSRWARRWSPDRVRRVERGGLLLATSAVMAAAGVAILRAQPIGGPSPFLAPVFLCGCAGLSLSLWKAFELWIKRDHRGLERGLPMLFGVSAMILALGFGGAVVDLYSLARLLEATPPDADLVTLRWIVRTGVLLTVTILASMSCGLSWFLLRHWVALVSGDHRETLGDAAFSPSDGGV